MSDIEKKIFEAVGAASVAWENPAGAGEFDSTRAKEIGDRLVEDVFAFVADKDTAVQELDQRRQGQIERQRAMLNLAEAKSLRLLDIIDNMRFGDGGAENWLLLRRTILASAEEVAQWGK